MSGQLAWNRLSVRQIYGKEEKYMERKRNKLRKSRNEVPSVERREN